ncbi:hypothetical protein SEPCBS119000_000395 [Sporothrix epigloea]|uniref:Nuclear pore complex component n=1 Tax=Sporothrix epigloea TaxID=1892477 RepID=A0ABP0D4U0_9PEZI
MSTPVKAAPATPDISDSPGNWRHPRMEEITRRRATTVFTEANLKTLVYNALALAVVFLVGNASGSPFVQLRQLAQTLGPQQYNGLFLMGVYAVLVVNMARSLLPLFREPDTLSDIPLTPSQRKLLGLPSVKAGATPNAVYTTPPRYARTPSVSGSAASITTATRGSGSLNETGMSFGRSFVGSPISGSPLFPKTRASTGGVINGDGSPFSPTSPFQSARKASFGSPGTLGGSTPGVLGAANSLFDSSLSSLPGTPSPTGKRLSMGLSNKWLYEKGRRNSSGTRLY